ncbi:cytochrome aa3 quinol oxidase subunit IV [Ammoniphilus sp. YIM 78166]|uniref:cytochrome aa3 quinol oxidase subunit IV n=1 Tax=Ammoniphilus sp. YIM 78166 TaxID=1644106 RepID=UPI0010702C1D|nr:cytochrome aa3 quinol oxidase subunit IV [Ammoniphilus sp. YIM 78166]
MRQTAGFPKSQIFGLFLSLVLTFGAGFIALKTSLSFGMIMAIIGTLALIQAGLQLFMFMHVSEGEDGKTNIINMLYSLFCAIVIVFGTIWVMTLGTHTH